MATYPHLVQIAWDVTNRLIREWQSAPQRWERERDIQTELASRLRAIVDMLGRGTVLRGTQVLSRVTAEPAIDYQYSDSKKYRCYPDIAIRNDTISDTNGEPNYLWVCEIKYDPYQPSDWDVEKLRFLANQRLVQYGCWLNISRQPALHGSGTDWDRDSLNTNVWLCNVKLPPQDGM